MRNSIGFRFRDYGWGLGRCAPPAESESEGETDADGRRREKTAIRFGSLADVEAALLAHQLAVQNRLAHGAAGTHEQGTAAQ